MKNHFNIRLLAAILCLVMLFTTACSTETPATNPENDTPPASDVTPDTNSEYPANGTKKIVKETKRFYSNAPEDTLDVAYYEDTPEILLINTAILTGDFFEGVLTQFASFEVEETETTYTVTRSNGAYCTIDFVTDSVFFNNLDLFRAKRNNSMTDPLATEYLDSQGNNI